MQSYADKRRSLSVKASWASLGLALGCLCLFVVFRVVDHLSPFEQTKQGLFTGFLPRTVLYLIWAGVTLAVVVGIGSVLLIRRNEVTSKAVMGILARSLAGIALGLLGVLFLWLYIGHVVIGF